MGECVSKQSTAVEPERIYIPPQPAGQSSSDTSLIITPVTRLTGAVAKHENVGRPESPKLSSQSSSQSSLPPKTCVKALVWHGPSDVTGLVRPTLPEIVQVTKIATNNESEVVPSQIVTESVPSQIVTEAIPSQIVTEAVPSQIAATIKRVPVPHDIVTEDWAPCDAKNRGSVAPRKCSFDTDCSHDCNFCSIAKKELEEMRIAKQWWDEEYPGRLPSQGKPPVGHIAVQATCKGEKPLKEKQKEEEKRLKKIADEENKKLLNDAKVEKIKAAALEKKEKAALHREDQKVKKAEAEWKSAEAEKQRAEAEKQKVEALRQKEEIKAAKKAKKAQKKEQRAAKKKKKCKTKEEKETDSDSSNTDAMKGNTQVDSEELGGTSKVISSISYVIMKDGESPSRPESRQSRGDTPYSEDDGCRARTPLLFKTPPLDSETTFMTPITRFSPIEYDPVRDRRNGTRTPVTEFPGLPGMSRPNRLVTTGQVVSVGQQLKYEELLPGMSDVSMDDDIIKPCKKDGNQTRKHNFFAPDISDDEYDSDTRMEDISDLSYSRLGFSF